MNVDNVCYSHSFCILHFEQESKMSAWTWVKVTKRCSLDMSHGHKKDISLDLNQGHTKNINLDLNKGHRRPQLRLESRPQRDVSLDLNQSPKKMSAWAWVKITKWQSGHESRSQNDASLDSNQGHKKMSTWTWVKSQNNFRVDMS